MKFDPNEVKICTRCKTVKHNSAFYKDHARENNLSQWCKKCYLEENQGYRRGDKNESI